MQRSGILYFFFFQAEDGIRDHCVTGVQTCALPISEITAAGAMKPRPADMFRAMECTQIEAIGRASCREKSVDLGGRRIIKKKKKTTKLWPCSLPRERSAARSPPR